MADKEKTLSKEEELAKASRMNKIRTYLPVVGLVAIFALFNFLTDGGMSSQRNLTLLLNQIYVGMIAATGVFFIMTMGGLDFSQGSILGIASIAVCILSQYGIGIAIAGGVVPDHLTVVLSLDPGVRCHRSVILHIYRLATGVRGPAGCPCTRRGNHRKRTGCDQKFSKLFFHHIVSLRTRLCRPQRLWMHWLRTPCPLPGRMQVRACASPDDFPVCIILML